MDWYYAQEGRAVGPVQEEELRKLIREGRIGTQTLVWHDGMSNWMPMGQLPDGIAESVRPRLRLADKPATDIVAKAVTELSAAGAPGDKRHSHATVSASGDTGLLGLAQHSVLPFWGEAQKREGAQMGYVQRVCEPIRRQAGWIKLVGVLMIVQGAFCALTIAGLLVAWSLIWMGAVLCGAAKRLRLAYESGDEETLLAAVERLGKFFKILGVFTLAAILLGVVAVVSAILIPVWFKMFLGGIWR